MDRRKLLMMGLPFAGMLLAMSLLYFWVVPETECRLIVYGFGMGTVLLQCGVTVALWHFTEPRVAIGAGVVGTTFMLAILVAGGVLLALDAPVRMGIYFLTIDEILYIICVGCLSCAALGQRWNQTDNRAERWTLHGAIRNWWREAWMSLRRHSGETDAEHYVRKNRELSAEQAQTSPPPLPERRV